MENSILKSVKQKLNLDPEYKEFDDVLIDYVNSAFATLHQLGVGPEEGFFIESDVTEWGEFTNGDLPWLNSVRTYVAMSVRLAFDPPDSGYGITALKDQLEEYGWRLTQAANPAPVATGGRELIDPVDLI